MSGVSQFFCWSRSKAPGDGSRGFGRRLRVTRRRNEGAGLRDDVRQAIERAWPDGMVEMAFNSDESYFWDVYPKLAAAFQRFRGAQLVHERKPDGGPVWFDHSDPVEDPPDDQERSRSYHLFFVCPQGKAFAYQTEIESYAEPGGEDGGSEEEWPVEAVAGHGRTGWSVGVSLLAPFSVITLSEMEVFEDGSTSEPSIESQGFTETGQRMDPEVEFRKLKGEQAFAVLLKLRGRICGILERYRIAVLPEGEWRKAVPWLRADEQVLAGTAGEPLRVLDALFFEGL